MKKKKLMFSEKYKRINGIYDIIDAFNIFEILEMDGLSKIKEYIDDQMNYYSTLSFQIRTLKEKFYHGKIYIIKGKELIA